MKKLGLIDLVTDQPLQGYLCHYSGEILHKPGEKLSLTNLALMQEAGIDTVIYMSSEENPDILKKKIRYKKVNIAHICEGEHIPVTLYDRTRKIVAEEGTCISRDWLNQITASGIQELFYEKDDLELDTFSYRKYRSLLESDMAQSIQDLEVIEHPKETAEKLKRQQEKEKQENEDKKDEENLANIHIEEDRFFQNSALDITPAHLKQEMKKPSTLQIPVTKDTFSQTVQRCIIERSDAEKRAYKTHYAQWVEQLQGIFTQLKANTEVSFISIEDLAKGILQAYRADSLLCLNLTNLRENPKSEKYTVSHCVNVCIISIGIADVYGYNPQQVLEIAVGALLHDIGHVLTYRPLLAKTKLDSTEQQKYDQHAQVGLAMVKNVSSVPISAAYIIWQHHERLDGSGRLLHCTGESMHDYAKLVGVADHFDTGCAVKTPYASMTSVIGLGIARKLDMNYVKALLMLLSVFPLGSYVVITGQRVCKVIGINPDAVKTPIIKTLYKIDNGQLFELDASEIIDLAKDATSTILQEIVHPVLKTKTLLGF